MPSPRFSQRVPMKPDTRAYPGGYFTPLAGGFSRIFAIGMVLFAAWLTLAIVEGSTGPHRDCMEITAC